MSPRYGILVQTAQLVAQLFIDWCISKDLLKPLKIVVPGECLENLEGYAGVEVTIAFIKKRTKPK